MGLQEVGWGDKYWIDLVQDMDSWQILVNAVLSLWVPQNSENFLTR
jgi:hypothetical protein